VTKTKVAAAVAKAEFTAKYIVDMIAEDVGPILVFSDHIAPCKEIYDRLTAKTIGCKVVTGEMAAEQRADIYSEFQKGKCPVLIATVGSSSTGINLTRASHTVFNDIPWAASDLQQAVKRIHRLGQDKTCVIHHIHLGPFDQMIWKIVTSKQTTADRVLRSL